MIQNYLNTWGVRMTELIIHGVNVRECENLAPYNGYDEETKCNPSCCQNSPNCNFKQLARAEQKLNKIREYCNNCNLKVDFTACDILQIIEGKENE